MIQLLQYAYGSLASNTECIAVVKIVGDGLNFGAQKKTLASTEKELDEVYFQLWRIVARKFLNEIK